MISVRINADDFGRDHISTDAILSAFHKGYISSTTLMCTLGSYSYAVNEIRKTPFFNKVGLHVTLTAGEPLTDKIKNDGFFCKDGQFHGHINRLAVLSRQQKELLYFEICKQIQLFLETGLECHHVDSHQHIHTAPFILPVFCSAVKKYNVGPIRICRNIGNISFQRYLMKCIQNSYIGFHNLKYSDFFGSFQDVINSKCLKDNKSLEIMCHPSFDVDGCLIDRNTHLKGSPVGDDLSVLFSKIKGLERVDVVR